MFKVAINGKESVIRSFIQNLMSGIRKLHVVEKQQNEDGTVSFKCCLKKQPDIRVSLVTLLTKDGQQITIPMLDMIQAEMGEGRRIYAGRCFDVFA